MQAFRRNSNTFRFIKKPTNTLSYLPLFSSAPLRQLHTSPLTSARLRHPPSSSKEPLSSTSPPPSNSLAAFSSSHPQASPLHTFLDSSRCESAIQEIHSEVSTLWQNVLQPTDPLGLFTSSISSSSSSLSSFSPFYKSSNSSLSSSSLSLASKPQNQNFENKFENTNSSTPRLPTVMFLGNHSSGKSTLINSVLGEEVQTTGVAPTDDGFTVLLKGESDMDEDGPTALSNPKYDLEGLRGFGQGFFSHLKVKTRKLGPGCWLPPKVMLIDTPGMIDTPDREQGRENGMKMEKTVRKGENEWFAENSAIVGTTPIASSPIPRRFERGYDFLSTVRWFATRCDLILLLFDPSNPGTTGETLDVLNHSLRGMEHKFLIVFNKVDVFTKVQDLARCYGALCWNLAKVIERKDLPRIHTMYTPGAAREFRQREPYRERTGAALSAENTSSFSQEPFASDEENPGSDSHTLLRDFRHTRHEVLREIQYAPLRHVDHLISDLDVATRRLQMSTVLLNALRRQYTHSRMKTYILVFLLCLWTPLLGWVLWPGLGWSMFFVALGASSVLCSTALAAFLLYRLRQQLGSLAGANLDRIFRTEFAGRLRKSPYPADCADLWSEVRPKLRNALGENPDRVLSTIGVVPRFRLSALSGILQDAIPRLRKQAHELKTTCERGSPSNALQE